MTDIYIHHHLGLGDMIHCNGMVRSITESKLPDDRVFVFSKNCHLSSARWMYRDEPRIQVIGIDEKSNEYLQVGTIVLQAKLGDIEFIRVGHEFYDLVRNLNPNINDDPWTCDMVFYKQLNMPYETRFSKCYWQRDLAEEERVFHKLVPGGEPYIFVHDDPARGLGIQDSAFSTSLSIVRNDITELIFHLGLVIERASEVHVMESSIRCMIEFLDTSNTRLFLHRFRGGPYVRASTNLWRGTSKQWRSV